MINFSIIKRILLLDPPNVTVVGSNTSVTSSSATLTCKATGVPDDYYRYGRWIQTWPGHNTPVSEKAGSETLILTDLTYEHSGVYTCSASNGIRIYGTNQEFIEGATQILIKCKYILQKKHCTQIPCHHKERKQTNNQNMNNNSVKFQFYGADIILIF